MTRTEKTVAWVLGVVAVVGASIGIAAASSGKPAPSSGGGGGGTPGTLTYTLTQGHSYLLTITAPAGQSVGPTPSVADMQSLLDQVSPGAATVTAVTPIPDGIQVAVNWTGATMSASIPVPAGFSVSSKDLGPTH